MPKTSEQLQKIIQDTVNRLNYEQLLPGELNQILQTVESRIKYNHVGIHMSHKEIEDLMQEIGFVVHAQKNGDFNIKPFKTLKVDDKDQREEFFSNIAHQCEQIIDFVGYDQDEQAEIVACLIELIAISFSSPEFPTDVVRHLKHTVWGKEPNSDEYMRQQERVEWLANLDEHGLAALDLHIAGYEDSRTKAIEIEERAQGIMNLLDDDDEETKAKIITRLTDKLVDEAGYEYRAEVYEK